jgi:hypothetical protein
LTSKSADNGVVYIDLGWIYAAPTLNKRLQERIDAISEVRFGKKPTDNFIPQLPLGDKLLSNK